jgi:hypothetical protein
MHPLSLGYVAPVDSASSSTDSAAPKAPPITITSIVCPRLTELFTPGMKISRKRAAQEPLFLKFVSSAKALEAKYGKDFCEKLKGTAYEDLLKIDGAKISLTAAGRKAFQATENLFAELVTGNYTDVAALTYTRMSCNLLLSELSGGALKHNEQVQALYKKVTGAKPLFVPRDPEENGHNLAYFLQGEDAKPYAILKHLDPLYDSSHKHVFEGYPLYRSDMRELVGYEMDALFALDRTPITFKITSQVTGEKGEIVTREGVLQAFVQNATAAGDTVVSTKDGGKLLKTLDKSLAQLTAISGIIKGRGAGHFNNYIAVKHPEKNELVDVLDIDLEECMIHYNLAPKDLKVKREGEDLDAKLKELQEKLAKLEGDSPEAQEVQALIKKYEARIETERKTIGMCRVWMVGAPQNAKPFDKAALMLLAHPSLTTIMKAYHKHLLQSPSYEMSQQAIDAQKERIEFIQKFAKDELAKDISTATPRDVYFSLFGGKELYEIARQKHYPDIFIFTQIVGCPYRHQVKDFSQPELMAERIPYDRPKDDSEGARIRFENYVELEKVE